MEVKCRFYDSLHPDCRMIRETVFVKEQGFENEFDRIDAKALHLAVYAGEVPVATGRLFSDNDCDYYIGRVAVLPEYRHNSLGSLIVTELEKKAREIGADTISLSAQCRVKEFYKKLGYSETDDIHDDEGCPHITMIKHL